MRSTGSWQALPTDDFTVAVQEESGALAYRWVVKPGPYGAAGQRVLAVRYDHATGGRDAKDGSFQNSSLSRQP